MTGLFALKRVRRVLLAVGVVLAAAGALLGTATAARAASNLVKNGSLENRKGKWTNTRCKYMSVRPGSKAITGWKATAARGELAWAKSPTCDGYRAAKGRFFVDLTGFGADAPRTERSSNGYGRVRGSATASRSTFAPAMTVSCPPFSGGRR